MSVHFPLLDLRPQAGIALPSYLFQLSCVDVGLRRLEMCVITRGVGQTLTTERFHHCPGTTGNGTHTTSRWSVNEVQPSSSSGAVVQLDEGTN
jgi:hypothetical protein